jgi:hypothetical protein
VILRGQSEVEVFPREIQHLLNPLAETAVKLVGQKVQEG